MLRQAVEKRRRLVAYNVHERFGIVPENEPHHGLAFAKRVERAAGAFGASNLVLEFEDRVDVVINGSAFCGDCDEVHA